MELLFLREYDSRLWASEAIFVRIQRSHVRYSTAVIVRTVVTATVTNMCGQTSFELRANGHEFPIYFREYITHSETWELSDVSYNSHPKNSTSLLIQCRPELLQCKSLTVKTGI